jgi:hypothetical protein
MSHSKYDPKRSKITELLLKLQEDSKLLLEFNKDPDKVMIEARITSEEYRNILKRTSMQSDIGLWLPTKEKLP